MKDKRIAFEGGPGIGRVPKSERSVMKRKRIARLPLSILGLTLAIILVFAGASCAAPVKAPAKPIKVAYGYSITGVFGVIGGPVTKDFKTLADQINKEGGIAGHPIELQIADTESDPSKARTTVKRLVEELAPHVVMGGGSAQDLVVGQVAAEAKVPFLAMTGSSWLPRVKPTEPEVFKWSFSPGPPVPEVDMLSLIFTMFKQKGIKKIALLNSSSAFGQGHLAYSKGLVPKYGLEVVTEASYAPDAVSFGPLISAIKAKPEIQAIFVMGADMATGLAIVALREAGIALPIAGPPSLRLPPLLAVEKVRNAYASDPPVLANVSPLEVYNALPAGDPVKAHLTKINEIYERALGKGQFKFMELTPVSWGSWYVFENAMTRLLKDKPDILDKDLATVRSSIRDYLETTKGLPTAGGIITMSPEKHEGAEWGTGVYIVEYRKGEWVYLPEYKLPPVAP